MLFTIVGILVVSIIGTLLHFVYEFSKHNKVVGLFSAVNESTWEHIKIALTAMFFWSLIDGALYGALANYFVAKFVSLFAVIVLIPLLFYGYKALLGKDFLFMDVIVFNVVIICSQLIFSYILLFFSQKINTVTKPYSFGCKTNHLTAAVQRSGR